MCASSCRSALGCGGAVTGLASGALELSGPRLLPMDSDSPSELVFELGFSQKSPGNFSKMLRLEHLWMLLSTITEVTTSIWIFKNPLSDSNGNRT